MPYKVFVLYLVQLTRLVSKRQLERKIDYSTSKVHAFVCSRFRHDFDIVDAKINSLHAPGSRTEVNRNLQFFFPEERILVVLKPGLTDQQRGRY